MTPPVTRLNPKKNKDLNMKSLLQAVLVLIGAYLADRYIQISNLSGYWHRVAMHGNVMRWLIQNDLVAVATLWSIIWMKLPFWSLALVGGLVLGLFVKRRWIYPATVFSIGFILFPYLAIRVILLWSHVPGLFRGADAAAFRSADTITRFWMFMMDLPAIPLVFLGAWFTWRDRSNKTPETEEVSAVE